MNKTVPGTKSEFRIKGPLGALVEPYVQRVAGRPWLIHGAVIALYVVIAIAFTYPLLPNAASGIANKPAGDQLWQASILEHQYQVLFSEPSSFFKGNFFFSSGNALFASDLLVGFLPLFLPLRLFSDNPILAFNMTWIFAFALNAIAMYAAVLAITRNRPASLLAGAIYAFAPIPLNFGLAHFQLAGAWWVPMALYFGVRFARSGSWRHLALAIVCVWLQLVTAAYLAIVAAAILLVFGLLPAVWSLTAGRRWLELARAAVAGVLIAGLFVPVAFGFSQISEDWKATRHITEVQNGSVQLTDYASPSKRLRWFNALRRKFPTPTSERRVFPGFLPVAAALLGGIAVLSIRNVDRRLRLAALAALLIGAVGVVFSLGTHWKWAEAVTDFELPYLFLFERVPGFDSIRAVGRFSLMLNLSFEVLAALGLSVAGRRYPSKRWLAPALGIALTGAVALEALPRPINVTPVVADESLERLLRAAPDGPILFVPVSGAEEVKRLWLSTKSRAGPLVNGYSGFTWPQYWYFKDMTANVPRQEIGNLLWSLRSYGIRNIVLDRALLSGTEFRHWREADESSYVEHAESSGQWHLMTLSEFVPTPNRRWGAVESAVLLDTAPPGAGVMTALSFANRESAPWVPERGPNYRSASIRWLTESGEVVLDSEVPLLPPPFLIPGGTHATLVHVVTPNQPATYTLQIEVDRTLIVDRSVRIIEREEAPFDGTERGLWAKMTLVSAPAFTGRPADRFPLHVDAMNLGPTIWSGDVQVRLGWRWFRRLPGGGEQEVHKYEGRIPWLGHETGDIRPGNGYAFRGLLRAPDEPGDYVVRISMVAELVAWFRNPPIEVHVTTTR